MLSPFRLRFRRLVFFLTLSLLIASAVVYVSKVLAHPYAKTFQTNLKSLTDKFDFSYLNKNATSINTLDEFGFDIERENVQFQFINPMQKGGAPQEILNSNNDVYQRVLLKEINEPKDYDIDSIRAPSKEDLENYVHASATIIALVRNSEANSIGKTIKKFEKSFNSKFRYPYTFLNDEPFSDRFKKRVEKLTDAKINYVVIPKEIWNKPDFIDAKREEKAMQVMAGHNVAYARKESYHNMCRFYLGNFYNVPELLQYRYYWRIEPDVDFYTDIQYDVFKYMAGTQKVYGFTINLYDIDETVASLWPDTLRYLNSGDNYKYINPNGAFQWLLENQQNPKKNKVANGYSTCHFWSNFEIGDMDFYRGEAYNNWFKYLDSTGNFYYERWGDAPVHSMGLALFADKLKIHWFRDIGYAHDPYVNCPNNPQTSRCSTGQFSRWKHLADQNCMASWIDYSMEDTIEVY